MATGLLARVMLFLTRSAVDARLVRARTLIILGAVVAAAGLAFAGTLSQGLGGVLLIVGWLVLVVAIHSFGRVGSE